MYMYLFVYSVAEFALVRNKTLSRVSLDTPRCVRVSVCIIRHK